MDVVRSKVWYDYYIVGNQHGAIAINVNDPTDVQWFTIDPDVNNDAFTRACGWAYPGPGGNVNERRDCLITAVDHECTKLGEEFHNEIIYDDDVFDLNQKIVKLIKEHMTDG